MKRLSLKYVAGLIDGEGCIDFAKSGRLGNRTRIAMQPRLRVTQTVPGFEVIELLHNNFGGHVTDRPGNPDKGWAPSREWCLVGRRSRSILQEVKNHLIIKRGQVELIMWWIDNCMGKRKHISENLRVAVCEELKLRKQDPHRLSVPTFLKDAIVERQDTAGGIVDGRGQEGS